MKINLGCGEYPIDGFLNIDVLDAPKIWPEQFAAKSFYQSDFIADGIPSGDNTVDYIHAGHIIEHLIYNDGQKFLKDCYRVLKPGGTLSLLVPDFGYFAHKYASGKLTAEQCSDILMFCFDAENGESGNISEYHKILYDRPSLVRAAVKAGFQNIQTPNITEFEYATSHIDWQTGIKAVK